jgi:hypothetical protein
MPIRINGSSRELLYKERDALSSGDDLFDQHWRQRDRTCGLFCQFHRFASIETVEAQR